jgi:hypothetical protein
MTKKPDGVWTRTVVYNFTGDNPAAIGPLVLDAAGNLYSENINGGSSGSGTEVVREVAFNRHAVEVAGPIYRQSVGGNPITGDEAVDHGLLPAAALLERQLEDRSPPVNAARGRHSLKISGVVEDWIYGHRIFGWSIAAV